MEDHPPSQNPDFVEFDDPTPSAPPFPRLYVNNCRTLQHSNNRSIFVVIIGKCMSGKTTLIHQKLMNKRYGNVIVCYLGYTNINIVTEYDNFQNCQKFSHLPNRGFFDNTTNNCIVIEDFDEHSISNMASLEEELRYFKDLNIDIYIASQSSHIPCVIKRMSTGTIGL